MATIMLVVLSVNWQNYSKIVDELLCNIVERCLKIGIIDSIWGVTRIRIRI